MGYVNLTDAKKMPHDELAVKFIETQTMAAAAIAEALTVGGNKSEMEIMSRYEDRIKGELEDCPTADEAIAAVDEVVKRNPGVDIIYIHGTPHGGAHAAIVKVGTPAYAAIGEAYPELELPPHSHVEPEMW